MKLLITGAWKEAQFHLEEIEQMGHEVCYLQNEEELLPCSYEWAEGVICNGLFLHHGIERFTNLRFIQLTSAGYDRVPMDYVAEHNITIWSARGVYSIPIAEYAVATILHLYKEMDFFRQNQRKRVWLKNRKLQELSNKKVCIVGCGNIGIECAKRLKAFNCHITGVDQNIREISYMDDLYSKEKLLEALENKDIVILTVPLNKETRHLVNEAVLATLKENAILVNLSRGEILDTKALKKYLKEKTLYAVLDVFEEEPLREADELWEMENAIITPHNSFVSDKNAERLHTLIIKNLGEQKS